MKIDSGDKSKYYYSVELVNVTFSCTKEILIDIIDSDTCLGMIS